jgi:hypothetical protein
MIKHILKMLSIDDFYGRGENIDIAKGKNQIPTSFKQAINKIKREWKQK